MVKFLSGAVLLTLGIFGLSLLPAGERQHGAIENLSGIPYPKLLGEPSGGQLITETLAHTDIFLHEPVLAKNLSLEIDFKPINLTSLSVGIREDSFWLSYGSKQTVYPTPTRIPPSREGEMKEGVSTVSARIPLTDKLQEGDRSVDLMFFAEAPAGQEPLWELHGLKVKTKYAKPTYAKFRNYLGSILKRERAL